MLKIPIIINNWSGGISDSPYEGIKGSHAMIVGCDIHSKPGILQISNKMEKVSGDVVVDRIKWFTMKSADEIVGLGNGKKLYRTINGGASWNLEKTLGAGNGQGLLYFKGYYLFCLTTSLGWYKPAGSPDINESWKSINAQENCEWHPMLQTQRDGAVYIGCGDRIAMLSEKIDSGGFNPEDANTYNWNNDVVRIPSDFEIISLSELGNYLMIGCQKRSEINYYPIAIIYPWDYVLQSSSHDNPIILNTYGINAQLNNKNILYVNAGREGDIFQYNGARLEKLKKIPHVTEAWATILPGAVTEFKSILHFGVRGLEDLIGGIYSFGSPYRNYSAVLNMPYILSCGTSSMIIGAIFSTGQNLFASWESGTSYGIDKLNTNRRYSTGAYFETLLYQIDLSGYEQKIEEFHIILSKALASGQAIRIKYRRKIGDNWTEILTGSKTKTFSYATDGAKERILIPYSINNVINLQFKVELETASDNNTTPELKEIIIR